MHALIEADGLSKTFGKVQALDGLTLTLPPGEPVAILGPNGAGKTTFVRMVATLSSPTRGTLRVDGHDVVRDPMAVRRMIGLAGQSAAVEEMMTGRENLVMVARLYGQSAGRPRRAPAAHPRADEPDGGGRPPGPHLFGRDAPAARPRRQPRRLAAAAPARRADHRPRPGSRNEVWDGIRAMGNAGTDIILTTQYLDEADHLAAHIVIIDGGRVIAQGTPGELKSRVGADMVELHTARRPHACPRRRGARRALGLGEPVTDPATRRCSVAAPGRLEAPPGRRPGARRRRRPGRGHRPPPPHARRGVPGPDRPHATDREEEDAA